MKIVCMSDIHGYQEEMSPIPDGDILLVAGDITRKGTLSNLLDFVLFLRTLPHRYKVFIGGNHDWCLQEKKEDILNLLSNHNCIYLENSSVEIEGLKIWGSPWTNRFYDWAFMAEEKELKKIWDIIPIDTDIVMTHGPVYGILDKTIRHINAGSESLLKRVKVIKPKVFIGGHIHEGRGVVIGKNAVYINPSICNENYEPINKPIVYEIGGLK